jgi:hypothetical protein
LRFILNARNEETPTQQLGSAYSYSGRISALKVPSAAHPDEFCLDILIDSLIVGEHIFRFEMRAGALELKFGG